MTKAQFFKYRHKTSSQLGEWRYVESTLDEKDLAEELMSDPHEGYAFSEHYRGIDIEKVKRPPDEWLRTQISNARVSAKSATKKADRYEAMLKKAPVVTERQRNLASKIRHHRGQ